VEGVIELGIVDILPLEATIPELAENCDDKKD